MSPGGWLGAERVHLDTVDSTSDELWRRASAGAAHGAVVLADRQTDGRGRQGRSWAGAPGNLFASWLLRFGSPPEGLARLSIVEGIAIVRALDSLAPGRISLKWPNDLLLDGAKVGGLLLESRSGVGLLVVSGLGLNLVPPASGWGELEGIATSLAEAGIAPGSPEEILDAVCCELEPAIEAFARGAAETVLEEWTRWSCLDGREIEWDDRGRVVHGRALGLAPDGGLRVAAPDGETLILHAGEVHLRGAK